MIPNQFGERSASTGWSDASRLTPAVRLAFFVVLLGPCLASAQTGLPQIRLDTIFPAGGRVGSTVEAEVGGQDFAEVKALHFDHPGLKATVAGPNKFKIAIAAGTPPGIYDGRVSGKFGLSNPHAFAVSDGLEEVLQKVPNHTPEQAQRVPFGCAVNGRFRGSQDDFYVIGLKKGQRVIAEVQAERLDSELDATLAVGTTDGREVASNTDYFHRDPLVDFNAKEDGDYLFRVWDFHYRGGGPYRLLIGARPIIDAVIPGTLAPGQTQDVTLIGRNLPGGKPLSEAAADGKQREKLVVRLTAPSEPQLIAPVRSPSLDLRLFQHQLISQHDASNPINVRLATGPQLIQKQNYTPETAQELPATGATVTAVLDRYGASNRYFARLKAKQTYFVSAICDGIEARGDLYIQVFDSKDQFIVEFDDHGANLGGAYRGTMKDPYGSFTTISEGDYKFVVRNRGREGSPAHRYILTVSPPRPDFTPLVCFNLAENQKAPRPLLAGASQNFDLVIVKRDNFAADVTCAVEGLPPFLRCPPIKIFGAQDRGVLVVTAAKDAPSWEGPIRVRCQTKLGDQLIERTAFGSVMTSTINPSDQQLLPLPSRVSRQVWVAVRPGPAPFALEAAGPSTVARGGKLPLKVTLRRTDGCKGKVTLTALQLPPGWTIPKAEIAAGASEATIELIAPANAPFETCTFALRGEAPATVGDAKKEAAVTMPSNLITVLVREK